MAVGHGWPCAPHARACPLPVPWSFSHAPWPWQEAPASVPLGPGTGGSSDAAPEPSRDSPGCLRDPDVSVGMRANRNKQ